MEDAQASLPFCRSILASSTLFMMAASCGEISSSASERASSVWVERVSSAAGATDMTSTSCGIVSAAA